MNPPFFCLNCIIESVEDPTSVPRLLLRQRFDPIKDLNLIGRQPH